MNNRYFRVGLFTGFALTEFTYFCLYLMSEEVFGMMALYVFLGVWMLIVLIDFYMFVHIKNLQKVNYKTVTITYKQDGKHKKDFPNVKDYHVDNWGQITFFDEQGILHCSVQNWKFTAHSED